jgi:hypothetical protein
MKREHGLVAAGGVSQSFLARMPAALGHLGPIKASSFRAARRIANSLRHGHATSHYSTLEPCALIWISVPESSLDRVMRDIAAQTPIHRTMFVLVGVTRDSLWPSPLVAAGARIATLNAIDGSGERSFVAEGHRDTMRELRRLFTDEKKKVIELAPSSKPFYFAGVQLSTSLLLPWVSASVESFRRAGFRQSDAVAIAGSLGVQALYAYEKAGRKLWSRKFARELQEALETEVSQLRISEPSIAAAYADGIRHTLDYFKRPSNVPLRMSARNSA